MSSLIRSTTDAYLGLEDPTSEEWERWYEAMLKERAAATSGLDLSAYEDPATRWPDFKPDMPPRPAIVAIRKTGGGKIA